MSADPSNESRASSDQLRRMCDHLRERECHRWRKGYGYTGTLHFGELLPVSRSFPRMIDRDEGAVMLNIWNCDRVLRDAFDKTVLDSRLLRNEAELNALAVLEGSCVRSVDFDGSRLSLCLGFHDGYTLEIAPDPALHAADDEHWALELHDGPGIGVFGRALILSTGEG